LLVLLLMQFRVAATTSMEQRWVDSRGGVEHAAITGTLAALAAGGAGGVIYEGRSMWVACVWVWLWEEKPPAVSER
jgi:hypothetical protein